MAVADIGVIGGSGFYEFLTDAEEVPVETPFGQPSEPVLVGDVAGRRVAFLPRHGKDHRFPPHKIPYRANLWALRALGVRRILAPSAVGSLTASYGPGTLVIPDQLVDRTGGRVQTFYDEYAVHIPFADPYCPSGLTHAVDAARKNGWVPASTGTLVVIFSPFFSSLSRPLLHRRRLRSPRRKRSPDPMGTVLPRGDDSPPAWRAALRHRGLPPPITPGAPLSPCMGGSSPASGAPAPDHPRRPPSPLAPWPSPPRKTR